MNNQTPCPECGKPLPEGKSLCPACLMGQALASKTLADPLPGDKALPDPPSPEEIADKFPQFEVIECLGRGGMGVVYKARQKSLDRWVAIKVLAPERIHEERFAEHFEREAKTLAKMSHPNIVTVFDHGESEGLFYIVMEFVDGVNLRDLLRDGKMEPKQALAIVPPICEALEYAHDKGVVHRDIKPENLLLDRDGRVKIADFGIASLVGAPGERSGTPPYMAPEQEMGVVDRRADIYALGAVLYEMLTGERPTKDLVAPSKRVEIDVRLDEIVLRALEKEPARRYQTAGEFRTVVETVAATPTGNTGVRPTVPDMPQGKAMLFPRLSAVWRRQPGKVLKAVGLGLLVACAGHFLAFGVSEGIGNELLHLPPRVNNLICAAGEGLFSAIAIVVILISVRRLPKLALATTGLSAFLIFCVAFPGLGDLFATEAFLMAVILSNFCLLPVMFLALLLRRDSGGGVPPAEPTVAWPEDNCVTHLKVLSLCYRVLGILLIFGAFILPIIVGMDTARDSASWNSMVPLMIAAIFAWLMGMGSGFYFVYVGHALGNRSRYALCRNSAIALLVLSVLTFPPLAILAICTLIVLNKAPVVEMFTGEKKARDLDEPATSKRNEAAGLPPLLKPQATPGMFQRLWWLFPAMLALGPLVGAVTGLRLMMPPVLHTVTDVINVKGSEREIKATAERITAASTLDEVARRLQLAREWDCKPEAVAPRLRQLIHVEPIANTTLIRLEVQQLRHSGRADQIADAITAAIVDQPEGPAVSVMKREVAVPSKIRSALPVLVGAILGFLLSPLLALVAMASLHRRFPEPQPRRWAASVAGVLAIALLVTMGIGLNLLRQIRTNVASPIAPGPELTESPHSPEHTARSFMEAIRDGDIAAAMAWMDQSTDTWFAPDFQPENKTGDRLRDSLQHISDEMTEEGYAGELVRLTQFTEWVPENRDETTRFLAVGIAAPSRWHEGGPDHALYLILSSTPDGWRVAHVGEGRAGKSLSEHVKEFLRQSPQLRQPAAVAAALVKPRAGPRRAELLDWDAHKGPVVLDLASGELLMVPKEVQSHNDVTSHFNRLGKGDIAWDVGAIITLRGARVSEWLDGGWTLRNPQEQLDNSGAYRITIPTRLRITTAEGGHYIVDVREKIEDEKGVRIEYYRSDQSPKDAIIGKWQAANGKTRIDFFPDGTMAIFDGSMSVGGNYTLLDDGRVKTVINVSGTSVVEIIQVSVNGDVMTTIDERGNKEELKRVPSAGPSPAPPETGKHAPEATSPPEIQSPPEGAEIRRFVLDLPVQPPLAVPKDLPLSLDQVKAVLKGVTWGKLLAALADDGKGDDIDVSEIPSPGDKNNRYEIAFSYATGQMLMELTVDWRFRSAEPSRLRPAEMPEKVLTHSSEFLPQLAIRYAMLTGHEAAAPAVEEAKAVVRQHEDRKTLQQYALALVIYQENMGSFPPDLATLLDGDYPGNKPWESLRKDGLMLNHQTGKMERPVYHGNKELRTNDHDVTQFILVAAPSADPQGKRLVALLDTSVKIIDEADYQKQVRKQAEEAKALGLPDQAAASNTGAANTQLQELTGILKRTVKALAPYQLELDGATGSMLLRGDVLKDIPDGTRIRVRGHLKTQIHDNSNDPTPAMPMQWHVYMDVREYQRVDNRFDKDPEKRPAGGQIPVAPSSSDRGITGEKQ